MINDGLWCTFEHWHMGNAGEVVAERISASTRSAGRATRSRVIARRRRRQPPDDSTPRSLPVSIPQKKGAPIVVDRDESIRADTTHGRARRLRPAFKKDGTVTAGNAPPVNDGAAALVVMSASARARTRASTPMARIVGQATSGLAPKYVLMTPVEAVRRVCKKVGWALEDVDLFEINEAFSVQVIAVLRELGIDRGRVNVNGGAVALGHPIGASGARILTTLLYALEAAQPETRHRGAVPGRRQRRGARGRAASDLNVRQLVLRLEPRADPAMKS